MRAATVQPRGRQVPDDPQRRELPQVFAARRFLPPARENLILPLEYLLERRFLPPAREYP